MMNTVFHKSSSRGHADHGWLVSRHTFSFAGYHDPERMHFGALRVLNDDRVEGGKGFGMHPHADMEIISLPLKGDLEHKDSMGNVAVIKEGDIQVMSAGTGVYHSEYNLNRDSEVHFLQIWVFPNKKQVEPRYDQISLRTIEKENQLYQILSPDREDQGVWIHQNAWFSLGKFNRQTELEYRLHAKDNGLYVFMIEGTANIQDHKLEKRDGLGLWNAEAISLTADQDACLLLMEVPMTL
jgi:redox-sensitive bicupin YhaK (pirin superfamily)